MELSPESKNKRLEYVRYADDFLVNIIGSKTEALLVKEELKDFLKKQLNLTLNEEKTAITH